MVKNLMLQMEYEFGQKGITILRRTSCIITRPGLFSTSEIHYGRYFFRI